MAALPGIELKERTMLTCNEREDIQVDPIPRHVHPVHHAGRREAQARPIIHGIRNRDATFFVDAAEYHCKTAFAVAIVDGGGNPITTAAIRTNSVSVAEEAAIALALQAATTPATIYSDSRMAVRAFSAGTVSSLAARIARDIYEEAIQTVLTVRDFTQVFDAYAQFEESVLCAKMEETSKTKPSEESDLDLELRLARFEDLMDRRPLLLNSVLLRQNPHNVHEWLKRVKLFEGKPREIINTFSEAVQTIDPKLATGKLNVLWVSFAKFYEENDQIEDGVLYTMDLPGEMLKGLECAPIKEWPVSSMTLSNDPSYFCPFPRQSALLGDAVPLQCPDVLKQTFVRMLDSQFELMLDL
ncbi:hypothetical protein HPB50_002911 [Hyalomma asiaticum]|uniref:Uncharacterized protein n=1 Tax=Hyalomma asiaticum TaxID=266040 RepID=A0ACB7TDZ7_HYAAI|nr:hypothetical protein HPB50_002911 [Hyalomma asiaticum]